MLKFIKNLFLCMSIIFIASSCSNPASPEPHLDADGLSLEVNEVVVYKEVEGSVITNNITFGKNSKILLS